MSWLIQAFFKSIYFCLLFWLCSNYFNTLLTEIHEEKKVFSCGICQKTYSDNKGVKRHIETFHEGKKNQKNHKCEVCDRGFSSNKDLKRHYECVHEKKKLKCDFCSKEYSRKEEMKKHVETIHEGKTPEKNHKCDICAKAFSKKSHLNDHISSVHEKKAPHVCDLCGYRYFLFSCRVSGWIIGAFVRIWRGWVQISTNILSADN